MCSSDLIISHTDNFMSFDFHGRYLKGFFTIKKVDPGSDQWILSKGKLSQPLFVTQFQSLDEFSIEQIIDLSDPQLSNSRNDIARVVGCSASAVYKWQSNSGLLD